MSDFVEGEHCWCKIVAQTGEVQWPAVIKKIVDPTCVIVRVLGTTKRFVSITSFNTKVFTK